MKPRGIAVKHWYDRDFLYPCKSTTAKLREALNGKDQKGS